MLDKDSSERRDNPRIRRYAGMLGGIQSLGMILFFPAMLIYLEIVLHWYMQLDLKYTPILVLFNMAFGFVLALVTILFRPKVNKVVAYIITAITSLIFCIEMICKVVLKQYYPLLSSADTAVNNKLLEYWGGIIRGVASNMLGLFLLLVPILALLWLGNRFYRFEQKRIEVCAMVAVASVVIHLLALGVVNIPWSGDFTPKMLYHMDTNVEDQVEQLGLTTMLRLDVMHTLFGVEQSLDRDFADLVAPSEEEDPSNLMEPKEEAVSTANVMSLDFAGLTAATKDDTVKWLNEYVQSVTPTNKNAYTGMFQGYNVIFITAEGFSKYLIDKERTPTLYKLANEGFVFNQYYTPLHFTSTSGGEFQNLVGLYPKSGNPISMKQTGIDKTNLYFSLANQLNRLGYTSVGFHNNANMYGRMESHTNLGYDWNQGNDGFVMETNPSGTKVWPQSDEYMMKQTVDEFINKDHFNVYYLTVSGHMPYSFSGNQMAYKNKSMVANLPYSDAAKAYLAANMEVEKALTYLLQRLEEAGKLECTLLIMTADHIPYSDVPVLEELSGKTFGGAQIANLRESDVEFDLYKNTLIMWSGSMKQPIVVEKPCGQVDILPTISNLLGLEYDSRLLAGSDILSNASPLVVFFSNSWLTEKGMYNRYTGKFTLVSGVSMTEKEKEEYVDVMKKRVNKKLQASVAVIEKNYYNLICPK